MNTDPLDVCQIDERSGVFGIPSGRIDQWDGFHVRKTMSQKINRPKLLKGCGSSVMSVEPSFIERKLIGMGKYVLNVNIIFR